VTTPLAAADGEQGASRFFTEATAYRSPTAMPWPFLDIDCSIEVAINNESTLWAGMNANAQPFRDIGPAPTTFLRCPAWVDSYKLATGAFCLASEYVDESAPSGIQNLFGEISSRESSDVEVLDFDGVVSLDQFAGDIVVKLQALAPNLVVLSAEQEDSFATSNGAFPSMTYPALASPKFFLCRLEKSRIWDGIPIGQGCKNFDTDVDSDRLTSSWQQLTLNIVATEQGVPMAIAGKRDRNLLELAFERPVQLDFDLANSSKVESFAVRTQSNAISVLGVLESKCGISTAAFESRETGLLPRFDTSKESPVSLVESANGVLQQMDVNRGVLWAEFANGFDLSHLAIARKREALLSVRFFSLFKGSVIQRPKSFARPAHRDILSARWIEPVAKDTKHGILGSNASTGTSHEQ
jgi:hypothetical protein